MISVRTKDFCNNMGLAEWKNENVFERSTHNTFLLMLEFPHFGSKTYSPSENTQKVQPKILDFIINLCRSCEQMPGKYNPLWHVC